MKLQDLTQFLEERPAIKPGLFFQEAEIPRQTWYDLQKGRHELTEETAHKLLPVMRKYGYKN